MCVFIHSLAFESLSTSVKFLTLIYLAILVNVLHNKNGVYTVIEQEAGVNQRWSRVSHYQAKRKESHSEPVTPLGTGHPMMFKKLSGCGGSPRPRAHHDPPLVLAQAWAEAGYSRPALCCRAILALSIVSECFPWLSAISVGPHLKPLHYGPACIATFAVLAFAFSTTHHNPNPTH